MSQKPKEPRCLARIVREEHAQYFANGKNKFYLEQRCPNTALPNKPTCSACAVKYVTKLQTARAYPHGLITEPIPDHSHLFGSEWYEKAAEKWGDPPARIVLYAIQFQDKARAQESEEHKAPERSSQMPRKKKEAQPVQAVDPVDPVDPVQDEKAQESQESQESQKPQKKKAPRVPRPRKAPKALEQEQQEQEQEQEQKEQEPKKRKRVPKPKKPEPKPIDQLIHPLPVVHQASVIPTHIEEEVDDVAIDGYEVEEVIVRRFVHQETTYFREYTKNKLYRCVKGGIGPYVGRWDPASDSVVTEVPDSDDEEQEQSDFDEQERSDCEA
jgi:hypothetical protein